MIIVLTVSGIEVNTCMASLTLSLVATTVEPLNRGHFGTAAFVLFSEVV